VGLSFFGSCDHVPARLISSVAHTHAPLHMSILVLLSAAMEIRAWVLRHWTELLEVVSAVQETSPWSNW
jgi:hypothetical protein